MTAVHHLRNYYNIPVPVVVGYASNPLNIDDSFEQYLGRARGYCNDYEDEDETRHELMLNSAQHARSAASRLSIR